MTINSSAAATRRLATVSPLLAASLFVGGCMSSPTYGTDKTASEQLLADVSSIVSVAPPRKDPIDYKPRPELVRPAQGQALALPPPQEKVASAQNPDWPESPEQRRARIRADVDANAETPGYQSPVIGDVANTGRSSGDWVDPPRTIGAREDANAYKAQSAQFRKQLAESRQGSATSRKYLSEPPLDYRQPAATAPTDELGEDELKKERRAKKAAATNKSWRDYIPWL